jgi:uncharacterized protein YqhQ
MSENQGASPKEFSYGGQAVIEGVMMRGAHVAAIAVRDPKGEIVIHEQPLNAQLYRGWVSRTPFVRGLIGLWDALGLGMRALLWSAEVAANEDENAEPIKFTGALGLGTVAVSLLFGIGLFFLLPTTAATGIGHLLGLGADADSTLPAATRDFLINLIEGVIQLGLVVGYMWLIGRLPDVQRLFGYHGAEHKTINAYEAGAELTPETVAQFPIEHPRCGTAFLLTVVFVSVLVFSLFGRPPFLLLILSRVICIPIIAGIAYELIRFTAKNMHNPLVRMIVVPNLMLQHLTTRTPDLSMIEVAIAAFKRVLVAEKVITEEEAALPARQTVAVTSPVGD